MFQLVTTARREAEAGAKRKAANQVLREAKRCKEEGIESKKPERKARAKAITNALANETAKMDLNLQMNSQIPSRISATMRSVTAGSATSRVGPRDLLRDCGLDLREVKVCPSREPSRLVAWVVAAGR